MALSNGLTEQILRRKRCTTPFGKRAAGRRNRVVKDYHINIFWSDEDGCYVADIPDLFACSAFGDSPEQALAELEQAKENWLAAAREAGKPIPEPRYRPPIYEQGR